VFSLWLELEGSVKRKMEGLGSEEDTQRRDINSWTTTGGKFFNIFTDFCVFSQI